MGLGSCNRSKPKPAEARVRVRCLWDSFLWRKGCTLRANGQNREGVQTIPCLFPCRLNSLRLRSLVDDLVPDHSTRCSPAYVRIYVHDYYGSSLKLLWWSCGFLSGQRWCGPKWTSCWVPCGTRGCICVLGAIIFPDKMLITMPSNTAVLWTPYSSRSRTDYSELGPGRPVALENKYIVLSLLEFGGDFLIRLAITEICELRRCTWGDNIACFFNEYVSVLVYT